MSRAVLVSLALMAAGSLAAPLPSIRATTPAVSGVEKDVPLTAPYLPPMFVVMMSAPGAETEHQLPKVEKLVTLSALSVAPTAIRLGTSLPAKAEGTFFELVPVLPIEQ